MWEALYWYGVLVCDLWRACIIESFKLYLKKKLNGKNKEKIKAEVERLKRNISQTYDFYSSHKLSLGLNYAMHRLKKIPIRL